MTENIPPPPKPKKFTHATYIPERSPQWKYHANIGQAKNAVMYMARPAWLYELKGGEPVLLWAITREMHDLRNHAGMPWNDKNQILLEEIDSRIARIKRFIKSNKDIVEKYEQDLLLAFKEKERLLNDRN